MRELLQIGTIIYGGTAEVTTDIVDYENKEALLTSFDEVVEIG